MRRPTFIVLACIGFILGVLFGYYFSFECSYLWSVFLVVSMISVFIVAKELRIIPAFMMTLVLAIMLVTSRINFIANNGISDKLFVKTTTEGRVIGDPYWDKDRNYVFTIGDLKVDGKPRAESIKIKTFSSSVKEGNIVKVEGKIYPSLAKPGYVLSYAKVEIINYSQPFLVQVKNKLYEGADIAVGGEPANFIKGILVGARTTLSQDLQDTLNSTGLSHVVAVSGYNLTILVIVMQKLLRKRWAWGSLILSLGVVWIFTILTGASASVMRAAIMSSVFLLATYYGRPLSIFVCISLTASVTLILNPMALTEDIGWQLSFLSLIGIVVLAPVIQRALPKRPGMLFEIIAVTVSAQIATVPYILYLFGNYSAVAFVANTVLMPFVPVLMLVGFVVSVLGLILPGSSIVIGGVVARIINYMFEFLRYLQSQEVFRINTSPNLVVVGLWYLCIVIIGLIAYNKGMRSPFQKSQELVK